MAAVIKNVNSDDFRGITLNYMAYQKYEHCLFSFLDNLVSSDRQFLLLKALLVIMLLTAMKFNNCFNS